MKLIYCQFFIDVIDQMVKSHFVTDNYYINECFMDRVLDATVEFCLEICIQKKCKAFSHSFKNVCVLNNCVSEKSTLVKATAEGDQFIYYAQ